ncbi:lysophospholipid acyltransferase family protein [Herpetosiphon llansteffanensis]
MKRFRGFRPSRMSLQPGRPLRWLAQFFLKVFGWHVEGTIPTEPKWIAIGAYHTSNWDFAVMLLATFSRQLPIYWIGKHSLFRFPFKTLMRWLGGIPIRRDKTYNAVQQVVDEIERHEKLVLVVAPEGTRKATDHWKTGFYYIALNAKIPICMSYINYKRKVLGFGPLLHPTGDIEADFAVLREFYERMSIGRFPAQQGTVQIKSPKEE